MSNQYSFERLSEELEGYRATNPELTRLIDLYREVFRVQESTKSRIRSAPGLSPEEARSQLTSGHSILEGKAISMDAKLFSEAARVLAEVFSKVSEQPFPVEELLSLPQLKPQAMDNFALAILSNKVDFLKQFAQTSDYNQETIFFFVHSLVVPFFQVEAENYEGIISEADWQKGICPFCGSLPRYARFDKEDGHRILFCLLCHSQWCFPRLICPFCQSAQPKLSYIYMGEDRAHRADVCNNCKQYIKTTDERALGREVIPQVEEVITIPLDYLAVKEGYHRAA